MGGLGGWPEREGGGKRRGREGGREGGGEGGERGEKG